MLFFFFFNDTATTEIYTLSLHDALPILSPCRLVAVPRRIRCAWRATTSRRTCATRIGRSEEHTSELQSQSNLVCRLLLEKKNKKKTSPLCLMKQHTIPTRATRHLTRTCT